MRGNAEEETLSRREKKRGKKTTNACPFASRPRRYWRFFHENRPREPLRPSLSTSTPPLPPPATRSTSKCRRETALCVRTAPAICRDVAAAHNRLRRCIIMYGYYPVEKSGLSSVITFDTTARPLERPPSLPHVSYRRTRSSCDRYYSQIPVA